MHFFAALPVMAGLLAVASAAPTAIDVVKRDPAPEGDMMLNITVDAQVWPPPTTLGQDVPDNLKVFCRGCFVSGDLIFSVGDEGGLGDFTPSQNFTNEFVNRTNFNFEDHWLGLTMHNFAAHIELEVDLTPSNTSNELAIHMLLAPITIPIPLIPGLEVHFDPQIHGLVNVSKPVTFTYGVDIQVPTGATFLVAALHPERNVAPGFNETEITTTQFQSSTDELEMDLEFSFRPHFDITLPVLTETIVLALDADLPKAGVKVSQVENVNAKCVAPAANVTSAAATDVLFPRLTRLDPFIGMALTLSLNDIAYTPLDFEHPLENTLPVDCLEYDPRGKVLVAPGSVKDAATDGGNAALSTCSVSTLLVFGSLLSALLMV